MPGLTVVYGRAHVSPESILKNNRDNGDYAWRVMVCGAGVFPMRFARRRDAEAALAAIEDMGDWVTDWERLVLTRSKEIKSRFLEAMQW